MHRAPRPASPRAVVPADGIYLLAFKVPERPQAGLPFTVRLGCSGESDQCQLSGYHSSPSCVSDEGPVVVEELSTEQTYDFDHCEYRFTNNVDSQSLSIHPGVRLVSADEEQEVRLTAYNLLHIAGTSDEPVVADGVQFAAGDASLEHLITSSAVEATSLHASDSAFEGGQLDAHERLTLQRSLVANGDVGVRIRSPQEGLIEDCVIKGNDIGVVFGKDNVGSWGRRCEAPRPSQPAVRDPVIRYTDIIDSRIGVAVTSERALVQIEHSNIIRNRIGVEITVRYIGAGSFISRNNFYTNGDAPDLSSFHVSGTLAVSRNYWGPGSGSDLSDRWQFCDGIEVDTWGGIAVADVPEAGPRRDTLPSDVAQQTWQTEQE